MDISVPKGKNSPAQEHRPQQDRAQVKGQEERLTEKAHKPEAEEYGVQEGEHKHQTQKNGQEDRVHRDGAYGDGPTRMEHMRTQHIMIRSKAVSKWTKPKMLYRRIKHMRKGKMVVRMKMMYESIEHGSAE